MDTHPPARRRAVSMHVVCVPVCRGRVRGLPWGRVSRIFFREIWVTFLAVEFLTKFGGLRERFRFAKMWGFAFGWRLRNGWSQPPEPVSTMVVPLNNASPPRRWEVSRSPLRSPTAIRLDEQPRARDRAGGEGAKQLRRRYGCPASWAASRAPACFCSRSITRPRAAC